MRRKTFVDVIGSRKETRLSIVELMGGVANIALGIHDDTGALF
jgi:hypothetical protein